MVQQNEEVSQKAENMQTISIQCDGTEITLLPQWKKCIRYRVTLRILVLSEESAMPSFFRLRLGDFKNWVLKRKVNIESQYNIHIWPLLIRKKGGDNYLNEWQWQSGSQRACLVQSYQDGYWNMESLRKRQMGNNKEISQSTYVNKDYLIYKINQEA